jgi:hypothetical protein
MGVSWSRIESSGVKNIGLGDQKISTFSLKYNMSKEPLIHEFSRLAV